MFLLHRSDSFMRWLGANLLIVAEVNPVHSEECERYEVDADTEQDQPYAVNEEEDKRNRLKTGGDNAHPHADTPFLEKKVPSGAVGNGKQETPRTENDLHRALPIAIGPASIGKATRSGWKACADLKTLLEARWAARDGLYVFHRDGQPLGAGAMRSAWKRGTARTGLAGRLVHDLRRTAARDMRRQGLSASDIMALCGWETLSMFQRYAIRDEAALEAAVNSVNASSTT
jgi:hypothetical protein